MQNIITLDRLRTFWVKVKSLLGDLSSLATPTKTDLVSAINEAYNHGGDPVNVVDNLTSDSATDALSAKQGKVLDGKVAEKMANTPSGNPCHNLFVAVGAIWNDTTKFWELNGLEDLTNAEMNSIYNEMDSNRGDGTRYSRWILSRQRTTLSLWASDGGYTSSSLAYAFSGAGLLVVASFKSPTSSKLASTYVISLVGTFRYCSSLRVVRNVIRDYQGSGSIFIDANTFKGCTKLEYVHINSLKHNCLMPDCENLQAESVAYIIGNAESTTAITITLHPTAYTRAMADAGVQSALQAKTNVTLASA